MLNHFLNWLCIYTPSVRFEHILANIYLTVPFIFILALLVDVGVPLWVCIYVEKESHSAHFHMLIGQFDTSFRECLLKAFFYLVNLILVGVFKYFDVWVLC